MTPNYTETREEKRSVKAAKAAAFAPVPAGASEELNPF